MGICLAMLLTSPPTLAATPSDSLTAGLTELKSMNFKVKIAAIAHIAASADPRAEIVLHALQEGQLYSRRTDSTFVIGLPETGSAETLVLTDALTGAELGTAPKAELKKVPINNAMRIAITGEVARLRLSNADPEMRKAAVASLLDDLTPATVTLLAQALTRETDADVKIALTEAIALADLSADDAARRLVAIEVVRTSMATAVRNRLAALIEPGADGKPREPDAEVRTAARSALQSIDRWRTFYGFIETLFFGLSLGFVLVLSATGLAITFGVMGVINMAHGELMMLGAYTTWVVQQAMPQQLEYSLLVAVPAAFIVAAIAGVVIERGVVRFLYGRPLETLLATFGISLILQQAVRSYFSPLNRAVATPQWMSGQLVISDALAFTYNRLYIIVFSILVFFALQAILRYTTLGLQVRAVAQNRAMARAMGVRAGWVDAITFGLGAGVAGLAGVALSQLTNVGPNLGQGYIIDSFMVVVFGGVGNLWGTMVAGLSLGVANKLLEPFAGAVLAKIFVLVFIILFIQKRPRGLFPQRGRSAEA